MKNKKIFFVIIVIVLIAIIGGILIVKNMNNEEKTKEIGEVVYDAKYESNLEVKSYKVQYGENEKEYSVSDLKLPYINLNSEDTKKVNKEIEELHKNLIGRFEENLVQINQGKMSNDIITNYNSYVNGNILSVVIDIQYGSRLDKDYYTYNFDLNTSKLLSYEEVYKQAGLTSENIDNKVENAIKEHRLYNIESIEKTVIENCIQNTIKEYKESDKSKYYLDSDNKLNIVMVMTIYADKGYRNDIVTVK